VSIQLALRDLEAAAARSGTALPEGVFQLFRLWFWLGWPAFGSAITIFALMVWKLQFW